MQEPSCIVIEDVDSSVLMARCRISSVNRLAISADGCDVREKTHKIDCHAEAAFRLKLSNLRMTANIIPYVDASINGCSSKVLPIRRESCSPNLASLVAI